MSTTRSITVADPPPAGTTETGPVTGTGPGATTVPVPLVRSLSLAPARFRVGRAATPIAARAATPPRGSRIRWDVSAAGTVRITIARLLPGRKVGTRCVAPTKKLRRRAACTRAVTKGTLTRRATAGAGATAFSGRIAKRALAPARYRATLVATAPGAPAASKPRSASFTIVRG